jgi:hypothetical protein
MASKLFLLLSLKMGAVKITVMFSLLLPHLRMALSMSCFLLQRMMAFLLQALLR